MRMFHIIIYICTCVMCMCFFCLHTLSAAFRRMFFVVGVKCLWNGKQTAGTVFFCVPFGVYAFERKTELQRSPVEGGICYPLDDRFYVFLFFVWMAVFSDNPFLNGSFQWWSPGCFACHYCAAIFAMDRWILQVCEDNVTTKSQHDTNGYQRVIEHVCLDISRSFLDHNLFCNMNWIGLYSIFSRTKCHG